VQAFTEKQVDLITTFANQAIIAIENTRLFEAEQQRTRELSESHFAGAFPSVTTWASVAF
jgi:GAF domain-containing protein